MISQSPLRWGADWRGRGLGAVRFLSFAALFAALYLFGFKALAGLTGVHMSDGAQETPLGQMLLVQGTFTACAVLANLISALVWRADLAQIGLALVGWRSLLLKGLAAGVVLMSAVLLVLSALGDLRFSGLEIGPAQIPSYALSYVAMFGMAAVAEQGLMRAFALTQLARAMSFWPAAILLGALFGLMHMGNGNESVSGAVVAAVFGIVAAYSFKVTGSLWFALGFHAAWDFTEAWVFGVPSSGRVAAGALTHATVQGPVALTGGSAGPEGGLIALIAILALAGFVRFGLSRRERAASVLPQSASIVQN